MKKVFKLFWVIISVTVVLQSSGQHPEKNTTYIKNQIFVKIADISSKQLPLFKNQLPDTKDEVVDLFRRFEVKSSEKAFKLPDENLQRIYKLTFNKQYGNELIQNLEQLHYIEYAEFVPSYELFYTPNDPLYNYQNGLTKVDAPNAWNLGSGSSNIVIAVVDNSIDINHEDLRNVLWINSGETVGDNIDNDGNGYIDDINGWDAADNDNDPLNNDMSHGTHCAGIALAETDNNLGIASLGRGVSLMAVKIGKDSDLKLVNSYQGVEYAIINRADIISMSWGGSYYSTTMQLLFKTAHNQGIICVAAAGNDNTSLLKYPASYDHVISVGSTDQFDVKSSFSNYGSKIDVMAPGNNIYSLLPENQYGYMSGTSMACPMVAGLCGLMLSNSNGLTPNDIETCITSTCVNIDAINSGYGGQLGSGRIDAFEAMKCIRTSPVADFTSDIQEVCPSRAIQFTDQSYGATITNWSWSFPGGTPSSSSLQNPTVSYSTPGTYSVTLTVTNVLGTNTVTKTNFVTIGLPTASLSGNSTINPGQTAYLKVDFTGNSPYDFTYTDGTTPVSVTGITSSPYYFPVSPAIRTTYTLTAFSNDFCNGTFSGSVLVKIATSNSPVCGSSTTFKKIIQENLVGTNSNGPNINEVIRVASDGNLLTLNQRHNLIGTSGHGTWGDYILTKLDPDGNEIWSRVYDAQNEYSGGVNFIVDHQGNIVVVGLYRESSSDTTMTTLTKLDTDGNMIFSRSYNHGIKSFSGALNIFETQDNSYVILAYYQVSSGNFRHWLIKTDLNGNQIWSESYGGTSNDQGIRATVELSSGNLISISSTGSFGNGTRAMSIFKTDGIGNLLWYRTVSTSGFDVFNDMILTTNNELIISGKTDVFNSNTNDVVLRVDTNGLVIWSKLYETNNNATPSKIVEANGNFYLSTSTQIDGNSDVFIANFDINGNTLDSKVVGTAGSDFGGGLIEYQSGLYILGKSDSLGSPEFDRMLIRTNYCLEGLCEKNITVPEMNLNLSSVEEDEAKRITITPTLVSRNFSVSVGFIIATDIACPEPIDSCLVTADFTASNTTICAGETVSFTNLSTNITSTTTYTWLLNNNQFSTNTNPSLVFEQAGTYDIVLIAEDAPCISTHTLQIVVNDTPQVEITGADDLCEGDISTTLTAVVTGGTTPYTYFWNTGNTTPILTNVLINQTYSVQVMDNNGCTADDQVTIENPSIIDIALDNILPELCDQVTSGGIYITVTGGYMPIEYLWSDGSTSEDLENVVDGTYTVTVTDAKGCSKTETFDIDKNYDNCCPAMNPENGYFNLAEALLDVNSTYYTGSLTIDSDVILPKKTFIQDNISITNGAVLDITNIDVVFDHNVGMHFSGTSELRATNSTFRSCYMDENWTGLTFDDATAIMNENVLKNAEVATTLINSTTNSELGNNQFYNDSVGIIVSGGGSHNITSNTFTSNGYLPFAPDVEYSGIILVNADMEDGMIAQNDFTNTNNIEQKFYGINVQNSSAYIAGNNFTDMYRSVDVGLNSNQVIIENNEILAQAKLGNSVTSNQNYQIRIDASDNILIQGNTIKRTYLPASPPYYGAIYIREVNAVNIKSNSIEGFEQAILGLGMTYSNIGENSIQNIGYRGIILSNCEFTNISCNVINMNFDRTSTVGIAVYQIQAPSTNISTIGIHSNCMSETKTGIFLRASSNQDIPKITNNYLYNYTKFGIRNIGFTGSIGTSNLNYEYSGHNSFILNNFTQNPYDIFSNKNISANGNYGIKYVNNKVSNNTNSSFHSIATCGNQTVDPWYTFSENLSFDKCDQYDFTLGLFVANSTGSNKLSKEFEANINYLEPSTRLDVLTMLISLLATNPTDLNLLYTKTMDNQWLQDNDRKWFEYYYLFQKNLFEEAKLVLENIVPVDSKEKEKITIESILLKSYQNSSFGLLLSQSDINKLTNITDQENKNCRMANDILRLTTGGHDYQFAEIQDTLVDPDSEEVLDLSVESLTLFPNPAANKLNVSYVVGEGVEIMMKIRDVHGRIVRKQNLDFTNSQIEIDISGYANGMYVLTIVNDSKEVLHKRFIKE